VTGGNLRLPPGRSGSQACAIPAPVLLAAAPDVAVAFAAAIAAGLALYLPFAVQVTLGQDYLPNRIGTASGVTLGLAISIGGLAAPLFGYLADRYGSPCRSRSWPCCRWLRWCWRPGCASPGAPNHGRP
jgi:fucose permease